MVFATLGQSQLAEIAQLNFRSGSKNDEVCFVAPSPLIDPPYQTSSDGTTLEAQPLPLRGLQDAKWDDAKSYRDGRANGICSTPSGTVQIDDSSKLRINGAVNLAMLAKSAGQSFTIDWTMADNTVVTLNGDAMTAHGVAVGQFVAACQNAGTAVRSQIDATTDAASLAALDITAGYPA